MSPARKDETMRRVLPDSCLEPLTALNDRVKEFADMCEPDHECAVPLLHKELKFHVVDLDDYSAGLEGDELMLRIKDRDYMFTEWSRMQLLDHLGTREKWFKRVTLYEQALELTKRIHTFDRHRLRRMGTCEDIGLIRGFVSQSYADIPDVDIMQALCAALPDGECLKTYSGKSDKAFYAYTMTRNAPLAIGVDTLCYPGAIVKNSEVGSTALWVIPFLLILYPNGFMAPIALRKQALLRRVHRGQYADLKMALDQALTDLQAVWGPLEKRLDGLLAKRFPGEQEALERLHTLLLSMKRSKRFIERCDTTYRAAKNASHNGLTLFTAVLEACATGHLDSRYDDAEVAGFLLLHLL
jgi:hypothetical protein